MAVTRYNRAIFAALRANLLGASLLANPATATENSEDRIAAAWLNEQGQRYEYGIGVTQQLDRALEYCCQAADLGHAQAGFHLGWLYDSGRLGAVDEVMAAAWLQAAQAAGHGQSQSQLRQLDALDRILPESARCLLTDALVERRLPPPSSSTANRNHDHGNGSPAAASAERRSGTGTAAAGIRVRELTRADIHNPSVPQAAPGGCGCDGRRSEMCAKRCTVRSRDNLWRKPDSSDYFRGGGSSSLAEWLLRPARNRPATPSPANSKSEIAIKIPTRSIGECLLWPLNRCVVCGLSWAARAPWRIMPRITTKAPESRIPRYEHDT